MIRLTRLIVPPLALGLLFAGGPVSAQSAFPAGAMPPPPSASDPLPKSTAEKARTTKKARPKPTGSGELSASSSDVAPAPRGTRARSSAGEGYSDRIDTRSAPASRSLDLEDDPRAVRPILQGGKPGLGMRF